MKRRGRGMACMWYPIGFTVAANPSAAVVKVNEDGTATLLTGTVETGQGSLTILAQIVAQELGIATERDVLLTRIRRRVDAMIEQGLVDEVRALRERGDLSRTASQAIGYQEVIAHLDGDLTLEEARDETVRRSWRFARRQVRWFRRDPRITWLDAGDNPCDLVPALLALWSP